MSQRTHRIKVFDLFFSLLGELGSSPACTEKTAGVSCLGQVPHEFSQDGQLTRRESPPKPCCPACEVYWHVLRARTVFESLE